MLIILEMASNQELIEQVSEQRKYQHTQQKPLRQDDPKALSFKGPEFLSSETLVFPGNAAIACLRLHR